MALATASAWSEDAILLHRDEERFERFDVVAGKAEFATDVVKNVDELSPLGLRDVEMTWDTSIGRPCTSAVHRALSTAIGLRGT